MVQLQDWALAAHPVRPLAAASDADAAAPPCIGEHFPTAGGAASEEQAWQTMARSVTDEARKNNMTSRDLHCSSDHSDTRARNTQRRTGLGALPAPSPGGAGWRLRRKPSFPKPASAFRKDGVAGMV